MKKIMLMATMMVATLTASAQYDAGTWSLNLRYGFSGAAFTNTPDIEISSALGSHSPIVLPAGTLEASATGGQTVGLELEKQLSSKFSLSCGIDWLWAGTGWEDHKWNTNNIDYKLDDVSIKLHYLAAPITANFYVWRGLALHAGVQFAYLTAAKMEGEVTFDNDGDYTFSMSRSCKSDFNKFDFSIPVGISYEWKNHLYLDSRFNIGVTNVNKEKTIEDKDMQNVTLQVTLGYKINLSD